MTNNTTMTVKEGLAVDGKLTINEIITFIQSALSYPTYKLIPGISEPIYSLVNGYIPIGIVISVIAILWMIDDFRKPVTNEAEDVWVKLNK